MRRIGVREKTTSLISKPERDAKYLERNIENEPDQEEGHSQASLKGLYNNASHIVQKP